MNNPTPQENTDWKEEFDEKYGVFGNGIGTKEEVKAFIDSLLLSHSQSIREQTIKENALFVDEKICKLLKQFANTPLDKRQNGWEWLLKMRQEMKDLAALSKLDV